MIQKTVKQKISKKPTNTSPVEKRLHARKNVNDYPAILTKSDGTKITGFIRNFSVSGLQLRCKRLSAHILSDTSGFIEEGESVNVESLLLINKKKVKVSGLFKLVYIAIDSDSPAEKRYVVGLQKQT